MLTTDQLCIEILDCFDRRSKFLLRGAGTTAVAIYDDSFHDENVSSRFKAWGNLPGDEWQGGRGASAAARQVAEPDSQLGFTAQLGGTFSAQTFS